MSETRWLTDEQDQVWRALLTVFHRAMPEMERTFKAHGLLAVHYQILVTLSEAPDRTMRLSELAGRANLSPSRLTHRLRPLVDRGEVLVAPCAVDGRAKDATLTDAGMAVLEAVAPAHVEDVQRLIFDHIPADGLDPVADALAAVAARLCEHPELLNPQEAASR
ncbi:MAG: MarR family transcriptional regulator [Actinomycetota bacterium]